MLSGQIRTIPLSVVTRSGEAVKESTAQLRVSSSQKGTSTVYAACEEGVFEVQLTSTRIRRAKDKEDMDVEQWIAITLVLLNDDVYSELQLPSNYENVELRGKLVSLEIYDSVTGDLVSEELAEEVPEFTLYIKSKGILLVTYGSFQIPFKVLDEATRDEKSEVDMLNWILLQSEHIRSLQERFVKATKELADVKTLLNDKENEVKELTSDYELIIRDMEDRFYQVLNSKRQRIWELEGKDPNILDDLNLEYVRKNETNLNRVNVEDIKIGDTYKEYATVEVKMEKKRHTKKRKVEIEEIEDEEMDKEESEDYDKEASTHNTDISSDADDNGDEHEDHGARAEDIAGQSDDPIIVKEESQVVPQAGSSPGVPDSNSPDTSYSDSNEENENSKEQLKHHGESTEYESEEDNEDDEDTDYSD